MKRLISLAGSACIWVGAASSATGATAVISGRYSRTEITSWRVDKGHQRVKLRVIPALGWHTYWRNPGDGGMPPRLSWDHTPTAQTLTFSTPNRFTSGDGVTFGYEGPFTIVADVSWANTPPLEHGSLTWAVCDGRQCTLEQGSFKVDGFSNEAAASMDPAAPRRVNGAEWRLRRLVASLSLPAQDSRPIKSAYYFPAVPGMTSTTSQQTFSARGGEWRLDVALARPATVAPGGVLAITFADGTRRGYDIGTELGGSNAIRR